MAVHLLPDALLCSIFDSLLSIEELVRCSMVCKRWWSVLKEPCRHLHSLHSFVRIRNPGSSGLQATLRCPLQRFRITPPSNTCPGSHPRFSLSSLDSLSRMGFSLLEIQSLRIVYCRDSCFATQSGLQYAPQLGRSMPPFCFSLKEMTLQQCDLSSLTFHSILRLTNLTSLKLDRCIQRTTYVSGRDTTLAPEQEPVFLIALSRLVGLQELSVRHSDPLTDACKAAFSSAIATLSCLTRLSITMTQAVNFHLSNITPLTALSLLKSLSLKSEVGDYYLLQTELMCLSSLPGLTALDVSKAHGPWDSVNLGFLPALNGLRRLSVVCGYPYQVGTIASVNTLTSLYLTLCSVKPSQLSPLSSLSRLHSLCIVVRCEEPPVAFTRAVSNILPDLVAFSADFHFNRDDMDSAVAPIARLRHLTSVGLLDGVPSLKPLAGLTGLRELALPHQSWRMTEHLAGNIAFLSRLEVLNLGGCRVWPSAAKKLRQLAALKQVVVGGEEVCSVLKSVLPGVAVIIDDGDDKEWA